MSKIDLTILKNKALDEITSKYASDVEDLTRIESKSEILDSWRWLNKLTKTRQAQINSLELDKIKSIILKKLNKEYEKEKQALTTKVEAIEQAPDLIEAGIGIEWKRSYMWGNNPTAELKVRSEDDFNRFNSGSIGGCGYDKESTAVANVCNQSKSILKYLYKLAQDAIEAGRDYREFIGYGSGYGILPYFEGGVGTSCYYSIFDKMGFKLDKIASGKTFDAYNITKK